ncbi:TetR/AcrR family transcriptional regulator [Mangrovibacterium diazotrophicum]|uniref:TetR family transcriptional regulator n=1 Tax=Mangrovibacterium diazotrophicum TaxID=1261403 RepID=A0A419W5B3_9BACT|nr:TetR family transcriptional regulator [Mangrovibacterium diazotrophicum]RKD90652.1 TetR family transcriptional regulator [Mangrovibacterium diazotrophicum]
METKDKKLIIVEKAEELFASQGFSGTSVREIAKAADVNVAMISYYFGSKEQLLMEILRYRSDYLQTKVDDLLNSATLSWWDKMDIHIDYYVEKMRDNQHLHRIIVREVDMNSGSEMSEFILQRKKAHFDRFCDFIKQGQEAGVFATDVDLLGLYTLLPGVSKHILFNQDFMRVIIEERTGNTPTKDDMLDFAKEFLKKLFRKNLEII